MAKSVTIRINQSTYEKLSRLHGDLSKSMSLVKLASELIERGIDKVDQDGGMTITVEKGASE
jgi:predicted DNA-binding protein